MVYPKIPFQRGLKANFAALEQSSNKKKKKKNTVITNELTTYARAFAKIRIIACA